MHDPKMANEREVKAQVKLRFHAANGTRMICVRNLSVTQKKGAGGAGGALTMKTLEGILGVADQADGQKGKVRVWFCSLQRRVLRRLLFPFLR